MNAENGPILEVVSDEEEAQEETGFDSPLTHTILEIWSEILGNVEAESQNEINPQAAIALLASWPHLKVQEFEQYSDLYYEFLLDFRDVVEEVIEENPKALKRVEEDLEENHALYIQILGNWQRVARIREDAWSSQDDNAHIYVAALADAINFTLSSQGLVAHLDTIGLQITEEDQKVMQEIIDEE